MADAFLAILEDAKSASIVLARTGTAAKNLALESIAAALEERSGQIVEANVADCSAAEASGMEASLLDRLRLTPERVSALATSVRDIIALPDPVGEVVRGSTLPNGLQLSEVRVPFGVVGAIYEARPNVTVDLAAILLKSGNAAVLRGGTAAEATNTVLVGIIQDALAAAGLPDQGRPIGHLDCWQLLRNNIEQTGDERHEIWPGSVPYGSFGLLLAAMRLGHDLGDGLVRMASASRIVWPDLPLAVRRGQDLRLQVPGIGSFMSRW